ncbi:MAG: GNAT family N-acetyltransferase [Alphaproteobacteria bacterium]
MKFTIHEARSGDEKDIAHVHVKSWKVAYRGVVHQSYLDNGLDEVQRQKRWESSINQIGKGYKIFVAKEQGMIIGFADIGFSRDENKRDYAEIYAIYLDPVYYGRGAGRLLFQACKDEAKFMGCKKMFVWVLEGNKLGRNFYDRMGAKFLGYAKDVFIEDKKYKDVCYEWADI